MATTELHKIPDTILSRSQVFEFKTIPVKAIVEQLKRIATAESVAIADDALALIARAAEGSMRDAQSALDQVMAFAGATIGADDVAAVLGLVGRELLFDLIAAVVNEDAPRAFALADRATESGQDLKLVCRELSIVVRDMMVLAVDPGRAGELLEGERARLAELGERFSREDLMRAFDLLANAEQEIKNAAHPRYHLEMALLKWMHLRKLVPLTDLLEQLGAGAAAARLTGAASASPARRDAASAARTTPRSPASSAGTPARSAPAASASSLSSSAPSPEASSALAAAGAAGSRAPLKDALLAEIRAGKPFLYNTVVAQAQRIEVVDDRVTFTFSPNQRALKDQFEQARPWLQAAADRLAGRKITLVAVHGAENGIPARPEPEPAPQPGARDLKAEALSSSAVQALLDVFPGEIRDVEDLGKP
jgi:DNA polymerase-3 subunit gamma/tau